MARYVILTVSVGLFFAGGYFSYEEKVGAAMTTYGAAVMCLIFVFLAQFKKFSGFGIKAEMWEQTMEQAQSTIKELQSLATTIAEPIIAIASRLGRFNTHYSNRERYDLVNRIEYLLREVKVPTDEIERAKREYHGINVFELSQPVIELITKHLNTRVQAEHNKVKAFGSTISPDQHDEHSQAVARWRDASEWEGRLKDKVRRSSFDSTADEIEEFIDECDLLNHDEKIAIREKLREELEDLRHYTERHEFRRPDVWFAAGDSE